MLKCLTRVLGPSEQQRVRPGRCLQRQLVQSQALSSGLLDPGACGRSETERGDRQLRDGEETVVIRDRAHDDDRLSAVRLLRVRVRRQIGETRERDGRAVDARHEEAAQDDLVEVGVGTACGIASRVSMSYSSFYS